MAWHVGNHRLRSAFCAVLAAAVAVPVAGGAFEGIAVASTTPTATCSQLTKAQLQPLVAHPITKIALQNVSSAQYQLGTNKVIGQTCEVADVDTSDALTITIIGGKLAAGIYKADYSMTSPRAAIPRIGQRAFRQRADSSGAVDSAVMFAINGSKFCTVTPGDGETPGEARLEEAAGDTSDIGDAAYGDIAFADGTICNRLFHAGVTNPAGALAALAKITPKAH